MRRFLTVEDEPVILDVGANEGQTVDRFLEKFPRAVIHSFEPSPTTFAKLDSHCSALPRVKTWNFGVGSKTETLVLQENEYSDMSSFLDQGPLSWGKIVRRTEVPIVTVDSFTEEQEIDFVHVLKSDTQGYDLEVFTGAERLMAENRIGLIYFELTFSEKYRESPLFYDVLRYLAERNFALVSFYRLRFQNDIASWTDALLINREYYRATFGPERTEPYDVPPWQKSVE
jgi:FkbM family methyltransferase